MKARDQIASNFYDEMLQSDGQHRAHYQHYWEWLQQADKEAVARKREEAELLFHRAGITFNVYGDDGGTERLIPFDSIPRSIPASEWAHSSRRHPPARPGAERCSSHDIYHQQNILNAGIVPAEQVLANDQYQPAMQGVDLHRNIYAHIAGVDMVRDGDGDYYVLEDNLRTPSGVSYMLENRKMMMRLYPELFAAQHIAPVERYPAPAADPARKHAGERSRGGGADAGAFQQRLLRARLPRPRDGRGAGGRRRPVRPRRARSTCAPPPGRKRWT